MSAAPMSVTFEEENQTKYSSSILLTKSGSELHTNMPQIISGEYVHGVSISPREIYTDVEEYQLLYLLCGSGRENTPHIPFLIM